MSNIQDVKKFIRHGKQARLVTSHSEPTTDVPTIHVQQQPQSRGHFSRTLGAFDTGKRGNDQAASQKPSETQLRSDHAIEIERLVAEEKENRSKMPKYPGLDRWTLLEKMGDGAFSRVYRAKDSTSQYGEVAIKVVRKLETNSQQRANVLKEVQIMRNLDHPNIVKLIDFSESQRYYYIILELCPGGELFHQIVRLTYFSEDLSRHVIIQLAKAVEYLHETSGVAHRDIKPENLIFYPIPFKPNTHPKHKQPSDEGKEDEGEFTAGIGSGGIGKIKLADFGLSKVIWDNQTITPCGTVGYTAPEIVNDEGYSKNVDMWAMGCVLYTLLCGFPPFYDESIQVLTEKVSQGQYTFLSPLWDDISKSGQDLISHLLDVDPERRYTIKEFFAHPWIQQTGEETIPTTEAPLIAKSYGQVSRKAPQQLDLAGADQSPYQPADYRLQNEASTVERPMDFRSPSAFNLREIFDIGYAIHRQDEEGKRRRHRQDRSPNEFTKNSPQETRDLVGMEAKLRSMNVRTWSSAARARLPASQPRQQGYGQHNANVAAAAKQAISRKPNVTFELNLDKATLLEKRGPRNNAQQVA